MGGAAEMGSEQKIRMGGGVIDEFVPQFTFRFVLILDDIKRRAGEVSIF